MKKILVLGSKPMAELAAGADMVFAANAAAGYYKDQLRQSCPAARVTSIVSAAELDYRGRVSNEEKLDWLEKKKKLLLASGSSEILIYGAEIYENATHVLIESGWQQPIRQVDMQGVYGLLEKHTGSRSPIWCGDHLKAKHIGPSMVLKRFFIEWLKIRHFKPYEVSGLFRPSTGILALLYAIDKFADDAEYYLSGISFESRGIYPDKTQNTWSNQASTVDFHLIVDRFLLSELRTRYHIKVVD